jgi:hypothetical protein
MDSNRIVSISADGIVYLDDNGDRLFLDFVECYDAYLKEALSASIMTAFMAEVMRSMKLIGEINHLGDILELLPTGAVTSRPYAEFYDKQLTRFEFANQAQCGDFHQQITELNWSVFDLTD